MTLATSPTAEFRIFAEQIADLICDEGIVYRPYSHPSLPFLRRLPIHEQIEVVNNLKVLSNICLEVKNAGARLSNNKVVTEKALEAFGWSIQSNDLDVIHPSQLVEIYNLSQVQIFRSFRYFEFSSYTLEDISCRKWHDLYGRRPEDDASMRDTVSSFLERPTKKAKKIDLPEHKLWEKDSLERLTLYIQTQWLIPLYHNNDFVAVMALHLPRLGEIL